MDIYRYLESSKDVKAYCREIGKTWNTYEMALIIGHSDQTRNERLAAWRELIDSYPDMPDPNNQFESVHNELARMIELEERELAAFKTSEPGAYYKISKRKHKYESFEDAFEAAKKMCADGKGKTLNLQKIYTQPDDGSLNIQVQMGQDGNVESLSFCCNELEDYIRIFPDYTEEHQRTYSRFYQGQSYVVIDIPNPFKRGDILVSPHNKDCFFLIDSPINGKSHILGPGASGEQTSGWGYYVNENGCLYGDHTNGYEFYNYYQGKLKSENRLLYYVGRYFKGQINIDELLSIQCKIILESQLKNIFAPDYLRGSAQSIDLSDEIRPFDFSKARRVKTSEIKGEPFDILSKFSLEELSLKLKGGDIRCTEMPIPFERGDILTGEDGEVFVFAGVGASDPKNRADCNDDSGKKLADFDNTTYGWGYFVNVNGLLYGSHLLSKNANYKYYKGKLEGNNRLLHYLSLYFKDEIGIAAMLNMQSRIMLECQLSNNFNIDSHGCYVPVHLLAENRLIQDEKEELERTDGVMPWVARTDHPSGRFFGEGVRRRQGECANRIERFRGLVSWYVRRNRT